MRFTMTPVVPQKLQLPLLATAVAAGSCAVRVKYRHASNVARQVGPFESQDVNPSIFRPLTRCRE